MKCQVDDSNAQKPYRRFDVLPWNETEIRHGKRIKIRGVPKHHKSKSFRTEVKLLPVTSGDRRTDCVVTNDLAQNNTSVAK